MIFCSIYNHSILCQAPELIWSAFININMPKHYMKKPMHKRTWFLGKHAWKIESFFHQDIFSVVIFCLSLPKYLLLSIKGWACSKNTFYEKGKLADVVATFRDVSKVSFPVVIYVEFGTEKKLVAKAITDLAREGMTHLFL